MAGLVWGPEQQSRLDAIRDDLAQVSTASACQLLVQQGWRNTYMQGLLPLEPLGLGVRLVGRARTCRYLMRRGPEGQHNPAAGRTSAEITLLESIEPGDFFCVDALGVPTAGIIGDILATRLKYRGTMAAIINGAVRDTPYLKGVGLPVFTGHAHPSASGRDVVAVDYDVPCNMAGVYLIPGDIILADDEGVLAMPLDLAEHVAAHGPAKERQEVWIRGKVEAGGSVHDYYPPNDEKAGEYERETGQTYHR
jgi:5-oxopent-3-ene-1,2,5-tricarboxylate decarboxylase/2-hydroxyhepta-2,4-diene-1,7-dioate isomerase